MKLDMQEVDVRFTTILETVRSLEFVQDRWLQVSAHRAKPVITNPLPRNRDITVVTIAFVTSATSASVAPSPRTPYEGTARKGDQSRSTVENLPIGPASSHQRSFRICKWLEREREKAQGWKSSYTMK